MVPESVKQGSQLTYALNSYFLSQFLSLRASVLKLHEPQYYMWIFILANFNKRRCMSENINIKDRCEGCDRYDFLVFLDCL